MPRFIVQEKSDQVLKQLHDLCDPDNHHTIFLFLFGLSGNKNYFIRLNELEFRLKRKEDYGLPTVPFFCANVREENETTVIDGEFKLHPFFKFVITALQGVLVVSLVLILMFAVMIIWANQPNVINILMVCFILVCLFIILLAIVRWKLKWGTREAARKIKFFMEYYLKARQLN